MPKNSPIWFKNTQQIDANFMNLNPDAAESLARTLFILGVFPQLSQTFIYREFKEMRRQGLPINLFAETEEKATDLESGVLEIYRDTLFRGSYARRIPRALIRGAISENAFKSALYWALSLPHRTGYQRLRFLLALLTAIDLIPTVRRRGYRYFHAHFAGYQTEIAMCLSRLTGFPYGATWHSYGIFKDRNILLEKVQGARAILTCTRYNLEHLRRLAPKTSNRIHLAYHGVDLTSIPEPCFLKRKKAPSWLAVGRLIPKKGFHKLIDASALLRDRGVDFDVKIIGSGELETALRAQIDRMRLGRQVSLLGELPNERVFEIMGGSTGLVVPSVRDRDGNMDGIPNVILEAMAVGKPVIGSDLSGIPEVVVDRTTGILLPSGDTEKLADGMEELGSNPELAARLGREGRCFVEKHFDLSSNVVHQVKLITRACGTDLLGAKAV